MRNMLYFLFATIFFLTSCKCEKDKGKVEEWIDSSTSAKVSLEQFSSKLKVLIKDDSGVFRSVKFDMPVSFVRNMEDSTTLVENGENYINYTLHLDSLEDADVLYYFDNDNTINKIEVDIYPQNEKSREELYSEFTSYFNKKYGEPSSEIEEVKIWTVPEKDLKIEMRMLGNAKVHDLQIDFKEMEEGNM